MTAERLSMAGASFSAAIWGRRGIVKSGSVWFPLAVFLSRPVLPPRPGFVLTALEIFLVTVCWVMTNIFANDLADCRQDRTAGKYRWICGLELRAAVAAVGGFFAAGAGVLLLSGAPREVFWMYLISGGMGLTYSLRPFRFKSEGGWGIIVYSLACAGAYAFLPGIWLGAEWPAVVILGAAVFFDKAVNLQFHQWLDHDADLASGVSTLAVKLGRSRIRQRLQPFALTASLIMVVVSLAAVLCLSGGRGFILGTAAAGWIGCMAVFGDRAKGAEPQSELMKGLPLAYLSTTLIVFRILPLLLLMRLCWFEALYWSLTAGAGILLGLDMYYSYRYRLP